MRNFSKFVLSLLFVIFALNNSFAQGQPHTGGINTAQGFKVVADKPIDDRTVVNDSLSLITLPNKYAGLQAYSIADNSMFIYDGTNWTKAKAEDARWNTIKGNQKDVNLIGFTDGNDGDLSGFVLRNASAISGWNSVTYGNGTFVAVANTGTTRVMTSTDGIDWTSRTAAAANIWSSVTYGNGLFVAVAGSGTNRVMTSPDGITWTSRTAAVNTAWNTVTYGNGLFVALPNDGTNRAMTSPDGITWTLQTTADSSSWSSITYGNGLFVAVATAGNTLVMTSPDGITWTPQTAIENAWSSVTYGNGLFVAVSYSMNVNGNIMTSSDGITWTARDVAIPNYWYSVTYGNGLFVCVSGDGYAGTQVMTSTNGINWNTQIAPSVKFWRSVTYGNGLFVGVSSTGGNTQQVITSTKAAPIKFENIVNKYTINGVDAVIVDKTLDLQITDPVGNYLPLNISNGTTVQTQNNENVKGALGFRENGVNIEGQAGGVNIQGHTEGVQIHGGSKGVNINGSAGIDGTTNSPSIMLEGQSADGILMSAGGAGNVKVQSNIGDSSGTVMTINSSGYEKSGLRLPGIKSEDYEIVKNQLDVIQYSPNALAVAPNGTFLSTKDSNGFVLNNPNNGFRMETSSIPMGSPANSAFYDPIRNNFVIFNSAEFTNIHGIDMNGEYVYSESLGVSLSVNDVKFDNDYVYIYAMNNSDGKQYVYRTNGIGTDVTELLNISDSLPDTSNITNNITRNSFVLHGNHIYIGNFKITTSEEGTNLKSYVAKFQKIGGMSTIFDIGDVSAFRSNQGPLFDLVSDETNLYVFDIYNRAIYRIPFDTEVANVAIDNLNEIESGNVGNTTTNRLKISTAGIPFMTINQTEKTFVFGEDFQGYEIYDIESGSGQNNAGMDDDGNLYIARRFGSYELMKYSKSSNSGFVGIDGDGNIIRKELSAGQNLKYSNDEIDVAIPPQYTIVNWAKPDGNNVGGGFARSTKTGKMYYMGYDNNSGNMAMMEYLSGTPLATYFGGSFNHMYFDYEEENIIMPTGFNMRKFNVETSTISDMVVTGDQNFSGSILDSATDENGMTYVMWTINGNTFIDTIDSNGTRNGSYTVILNDEYFPDFFKYKNGFIYVGRNSQPLRKISTSDLNGGLINVTSAIYNRYAFDFEYGTNNLIVGSFDYDNSIGKIEKFDSIGNLLYTFNIDSEYLNSTVDFLSVDDKNNIYYTQYPNIIKMTYNYETETGSYVILSIANLNTSQFTIDGLAEDVYADAGPANIVRFKNDGDYLGVDSSGTIIRKKIESSSGGSGDTPGIQQVLDVNSNATVTNPVNIGSNNSSSVKGQFGLNSNGVYLQGQAGGVDIQGHTGGVTIDGGSTNGTTINNTLKINANNPIEISSETNFNVLQFKNPAHIRWTYDSDTEFINRGISVDNGMMQRWFNTTYKPQGGFYEEATDNSYLISFGPNENSRYFNINNNGLRFYTTFDTGNSGDIINMYAGQNDRTGFMYKKGRYSHNIWGENAGLWLNSTDDEFYDSDTNLTGQQINSFQASGNQFFITSSLYLPSLPAQKSEIFVNSQTGFKINSTSSVKINNKNAVTSIDEIEADISGDVRLHKDLGIYSINYAISGTNESTYRGMAYGAGKFVTVSNTGTNKATYSTDGSTWSNGTGAIAESNNWHDVIYGGGKFVAIGSNSPNQVMTSTDGIAWTAQNTGTFIANGWNSIAYGDGQYIVLIFDGTGTKMMYSSDAVTWTQRTAFTTTDIARSINYGNGLWVITKATGDNRILTSTDGITWTPRGDSAINATRWQDAVYGDGMWVATEELSPGRVATSPDGITWTIRETSATEGLGKIEYGDGTFVAININTNVDDTVLIASIDKGVTWTKVKATGNDKPGSGTGIAYNGKRFVVCSWANTIKIYTANLQLEKVYENIVNEYRVNNVTVTPVDKVLNISTTAGNVPLSGVSPLDQITGPLLFNNASRIEDTGGNLELHRNAGKIKVTTEMEVNYDLELKPAPATPEVQPGLILTSPNGSRYRLKVSDAGVLSTELVP